MESHDQAEWQRRKRHREAENVEIARERRLGLSALAIAGGICLLDGQEVVSHGLSRLSLLGAAMATGLGCMGYMVLKDSRQQIVPGKVIEMDFAPPDRSSESSPPETFEEHGE